MAGDELDLFSAPARAAAGKAPAEEASEAAPPPPDAPLADRMRPRSFDEWVGHARHAGPASALRALFEAGELPSLILHGPPGSGKTTLARLLAARPGTRLAEVSAVMAGVKEIRAVVDAARHARRGGVRTLLFIDEIHRLNRAQQDVLLPHVEAGTVTLVGATTGNPSFEVNAPLLSRCRVVALEALDAAAIASIVERALRDEERGLGSSGVQLAGDVCDAIARESDGDARRALGMLEAAVALHRQRGAQGSVGLETLREATGQRTLRYDRDRDEHYDLTSAFIKSVRASDPDAALYYLARMLEGGEDPLFIARRLVILASEDVGNADPGALPLAVAAFEAVERIGLPEGRIALAQATTWLACAPKSNAAYAALEAARRRVRETGALPVPLHLRNAATAWMASQGCGEGYRSPHDEADGFVDTPNLPDGVGPVRFYAPRDAGAEGELAARLAAWRARRDGSA